MKNKFRICLTLLISLTIIFALAGCGTQTKTETADDGTPKDYITREQYDALTNTTWGTMTLEEMNTFFGVDGTVNEERSAEWGDGYQVVEWFGKDGVGSVIVLFQEDEDGNMFPCSLSPSSDLK